MKGRFCTCSGRTKGPCSSTRMRRLRVGSRMNSPFATTEPKDPPPMTMASKSRRLPATAGPVLSNASCSVLQRKRPMLSSVKVVVSDVSGGAMVHPPPGPDRSATGRASWSRRTGGWPAATKERSWRRADAVTRPTHRTAKERGCGRHGCGLIRRCWARWAWPQMRPAFDLASTAIGAAATVMVWRWRAPRSPRSKSRPGTQRTSFPGSHRCGQRDSNPQLDFGRRAGRGDEADVTGRFGVSPARYAPGRTCPPASPRSSSRSRLCSPATPGGTPKCC